MTTENAVAKTLVKTILSKDLTISVFDGECFSVKRSHQAAVIFAAMADVEECTLRLRTKAGDIIGSILLVWGNSPEELIADHSSNEIINNIIAIVEQNLFAEV